MRGLLIIFFALIIFSMVSLAGLFISISHKDRVDSLKPGPNVSLVVPVVNS